MARSLAGCGATSGPTLDLCNAGLGPASPGNGSMNVDSPADAGCGIGDVLDVAVDELPAVAAVDCAGASLRSRLSWFLSAASAMRS